MMLPLFLRRAASGETVPGLVLPAATLKRELHGWAGLSVSALAVAGLLVLLIVPARTPGVQDILPFDPNVFFRQALVTHVVFSVVIWFLGGLGMLSVLATRRLSEASEVLRAGWLGSAGLWLTMLAMGLLVVGTLAGAGRPSLNNYVPVLVHPLYYAGLGLLFLGVALPVARLLLNMAGPERRESFVVGTAAVGVTYLMAPLCILIAWIDLPAGKAVEDFNELLFWGGGHVLQVVNTGVMILAWHLVAHSAWGESLMPRPLMMLVVLALTATGAAAVVIALTTDVTGSAQYTGFTELYLYALVIPSLIASGAVAQLLWRRRGRLDWRDPGTVGLALSLVLFGVGGVLGYGLGQGDTRTPAHYHAVIGGVNLALMALFVACVLPLLERPFARARFVLWFLWLYFAGQLVHSVGLYVAGTRGVARKTAGAEQGLDSALEIAGMAVMGLGGLVAVVGGVMFVWMAGRRLLPQRHLANT